jgi:hypothetical protein
MAARLPSLGLTAVVPHFGSLARDPTNPSAWYIAADALDAGRTRPFLLFLSLASAPANPSFASAIPVGRMRPGGGWS